MRSVLLRDASLKPGSMLTRRSNGDRRSVPLAFALSAAVPGAGQVYNGQWIKAAAGIVVEAAVITTWQLLRSKGLDEEDQFRAVAHRDWDPLKYAAWLNDYSAFLQAEHGATVTAPPIVPASAVDFRHPDSWSVSDQQESARMFAEIHALEREMFHPETGATFSHRLPTFGDQQYYELIGKYFQFAPGWGDYPEWIAGDGAFTNAIDPELSGPGGGKPNVSPSFFTYARDHAHAQDVLRTATRVSLLLIVNHLVAAIDAAVTSKLHNDRISTSVGLVRVGDGAAGATASVSLRF